MKSGDMQSAKVGSSTLVIVESLRRFIHSHANGTPAQGQKRSSR